MIGPPRQAAHFGQFVDEDHHGDRQPAEDVDRYHAVGDGRGNRWGGSNNLRSAHGLVTFAGEGWSESLIARSSVPGGSFEYSQNITPASFLSSTNRLFAAIDCGSSYDTKTCCCA